MNTPTKVGIGLICLVLICGGTPLFFYAKSDIPEAAGKLDQNLENAKRAGLWTRRTDLIASYKVPENENAGPILTKLLAKTTKVLKSDTTYWKNGQLDELATLNAWNQLEGDLKLIDESESKPHCKFPRDLRLLPATLFPEYGRLRLVWKLLAARSRLAIQQNDVTTATLCWRRMTTLAKHLRDENVIIADLVRTSVSANLCDTLQLALNQRARQAIWVDAVSEALSRIDKPHDVRAVLSYELVNAIDGVFLFEKRPRVAVGLMGGYDEPVDTDVNALRFIPGIRNASISRFAEAYSNAAEAIDAGQRDSKRIRKALTDIDNTFEQTGKSRLIPCLLAPIFAPWGEAIAKDYARLAVLRNSIRALRGEKLDLTTTPDFDLKPLRTNQTAEGLVIYSIGQDRKDDGGDLTPTKSGSQFTKDFGVLVPR